ncbi:MAG: pilin [Bacteroidota bacterium]
MKYPYSFGLLIITVYSGILINIAHAASTDPDKLISCSWQTINAGSPDACGEVGASTYPMDPIAKQKCLDYVASLNGPEGRPSDGINCDYNSSSIHSAKTRDETNCQGSNPGNSNCCCTYGAKSDCIWYPYWPKLYDYAELIGFDTARVYGFESVYKACGSNVPNVNGDPDRNASAVCSCGGESEKPQSGNTASGNRILPPVNFTPQVTIPGSNFQAGTDITLTEKSTTYIGQYVSAFYNYAMGIVGILAVIVLMIGGIIWLTSAGNPSKITQAKDLMIGSITGLVSLLISWILLNTVNPDLIKFKITKIGQIDETNLSPVNLIKK